MPERMKRGRAHRNHARNGNGAYSVLIVDDDRRFVNSLRRWAHTQGARVTVAHNGRDALRLLRLDRYDLVLVDLRMPQMDGYELHLRLAIEHPELLRRTIFVTGDLNDPEAKAFAERSGCVCLEKPLPLRDLAGFVQKTA
jgi:CheY-like chemotaxis protein